MTRTNWREVVRLSFLLVMGLPAAVGSGDECDVPFPDRVCWGCEFRSLGKIWRYHSIRDTNPCGTELLLCGATREFVIYDLCRGTVDRSFTARESIFDASFSHDGRLLAVAEWRDGFTLRDAQTLKVLDRFKGSGGLGAWQARFVRDTNRLALYSWWRSQKQYWLYDWSTKQELGWPSYAQVDQSNRRVRERLARFGPSLFSVEKSEIRGRATGFRVWVTDPVTGEPGTPTVLHDKDLFQYDVRYDGRRAVIMRPGEAARVLDLESGNTVASLGGQELWTACAAFSPDGRLVATASGSMAVSQGGSLTSDRPRKDGEHLVVIHDAETGYPIAILKHSDRARDYRSLGFSRDGRYVWAVTKEREVVLWGDLPKMPDRMDPLPNFDHKYQRSSAATKASAPLAVDTSRQD